MLILMIIMMKIQMKIMMILTTVIMMTKPYEYDDDTDDDDDNYHKNDSFPCSLFSFLCSSSLFQFRFLRLFQFVSCVSLVQAVWFAEVDRISILVR